LIATTNLIAIPTIISTGTAVIGARETEVRATGGRAARRAGSMIPATAKVLTTRVRT
jgi:hypothetical protein